MKLTKKELNQHLVEERRKMRTKQQNSDFFKRTLSIYNGQKKRAKEERGVDSLPFTLAEFRDFFAAGLEKVCPYSGHKLLLKSATSDHRMPISRMGELGLENQVVCSTSSNLQKGKMAEEEFKQIMALATFLLPPHVLSDFKGRLTTGGKWIGKG
jgi:5-methylcytosine-specific restriction endonuclease McrA